MASSSSPPRPVVLVVEDEPLLMMSAVEMVESLGYAVVEATDADQACKILEERKDIRVVFTDIQMPGTMDGLKLASVIRDRWPPIEIIVTSGVLTARDIDLPARSLFFSKPYSVERVGAAIRAFVGETSDPPGA